jgi:acetyltransferase-like isoleucine patch superfamily enzyme
MPYLNGDELRSLGFQFLGRNVRISSKASIYDARLIMVGDNSRIDDFCVISGRVEIGRNVHIAVFCNIAGGSEGVFIEDFSGVAYGSSVFSQSDDYSGRSMTGPTIPSTFKCETKKAVRICRHSIVGAGSIVLPGVILNEGTAIGAMTLVTKTTQAWSIYFGIPAKWIRERSKDLLDMEVRYLASEVSPIESGES